MKQWLIPAVVLLAVGGVGVGVGWSVNEWWDDEGAGKREAAPSPTPNPVLITGTEAAVIAENWLWSDATKPLFGRCTTNELNRVSNRWIVSCGVRGLNTTVLAVDARTGRVTRVP